ncbi:MAG TPA: DUF1501 domain-containing protein [Planctomycetota bacterium]|jgi:hypothetical protein|nr:DUF1501 domain-containing protein [Planctomycetota bacterium]
MWTLSRREILSLGAGAGLSFVARSVLPVETVSRRKPKKVIWLWMDGGMCQGHTWDPKPNSKLGCQVKAIDTAVPGIQVSEFLPLCAARMNNLSIIRSVTHGLHHHELATSLMHGDEPFPAPQEAAPLGSILAYELGAKGFPLPPQIVMEGPALRESRIFGDEYCPFEIGDGMTPIPNLRRAVAAERDRSRAALLLEQNRDWDAMRQQVVVQRLEHAYVKSEELISTPLLRAFNVNEEPEALRKEYGDGFGQRCLVARRLVQAGCPFVEIGLKGWQRHPYFCSNYPTLISILDRGLGSLIKDLDGKGMLSDTVVVCATEFGKPPQSRAESGDAWTGAFSVVLAGGFLRGGTVVGDTGPNGLGCQPPVPVKDLLATIYCACGVDWEKEYRTESLRRKTYGLGGKPLIDLF